MNSLKIAGAPCRRSNSRCNASASIDGADRIAVQMPQSSIIVCPDSNIKLWATRTKDAAIGGGKSAILQLAKAWARAGSDVTVAGRIVVEGQAEGISLVNIERVLGSFDVG